MKRILLLSIMVILFTGIVSANIIFPDLEENYKLNEKVNLSFSIESSKNVFGSINMELKCGKFSEKLIESSVNILKGELLTLEVPEHWLEKLGECHLYASLKDSGNNLIEDKISQSFSVETPIKISVTLNKHKYSPGDRLTIRGTAQDFNGKAIEGEARLKIEDEYTVKVRDGRFYLDTSLRDQIKSGKHEVIITVEDESGESSQIIEELEIEAIATSLEIYLNDNSFYPEDLMKVSAVLKDQNSEEIKSEISLTIYNSRGAEIRQVKLEGEVLEFKLPSNSEPGEWWIYVFASGLKARKYFDIEESIKLDAVIEENLLKIINEGNVHYSGNVLINFYEGTKKTTDVKKISLGVGKEVVFELSAPEGDYEVGIVTEEYEENFAGISLTGGAIGVKLKQDTTAAALIIGAIVGIAFLALALKLNFKKKVKKSDEVSDL